MLHPQREISRTYLKPASESWYACDCVGSTIPGESWANSASGSVDLGEVRGQGLRRGWEKKGCWHSQTISSLREETWFLPRNNLDLVWPEVDKIWGCSLRKENIKTKIKCRVSKGSGAWDSSLISEIPSKPTYFSPVLLSHADEQRVQRYGVIRHLLNTEWN